MFLAVISLFISCTSWNGDSISTIDAAKDSVLFYYKRSLKNDRSLTEKKQAIDRALFLAKNFEKDTLYSYILYQKGSLNFTSGEYDSLLVYNNLLLKHALQTNDVPMLARQHYLMGHYFSQTIHNSEKAFQNYTLSKGYYEQIGDSSWVGRNLLNMGTIQKDFNDFFGSKETLTEAIQFLTSKNDTTYIAQCYNLLATDHRKLLNYSDAVKYYNKAIAASSVKKDILGYKNNLAVTLIDNGKYEDAIGILQKISSDSSLDHSSKPYARVLDNLAYAQWLSGKENKVDSFLKALDIRTQNKDKRGLIASYTHLGEFYSKDRPQRAKAYFDTVIGLSKTIKMPRAEKDAIKFLMQLEPTNVQLRDRYIFLQDSLYAQELQVKTQFAKYKYDNKAAQEKSLRLEKENAEKALEVTQQRTQKTISYFGLALLLLTSGFGVYFFRQRTQRLQQENKTAKLEATLETEAEMSRRLHDDHGGKLNKTMILVQNDADKALVLDNLETLYNQTRDFSREINEVGTGPNFKEEFFEMLRLRTPSKAKLFTTGSKEINWTAIAPLTKTVLYKVLQELMINMGKYSEATLVTIAFQKTGKVLRVDYTDDGVGASIEDLNAKNGLRNTEKRIQAIGGTITFDSGKGDGFKASITLPN